jgi:hypothetical protein
LPVEEVVVEVRAMLRKKVVVAAGVVVKVRLILRKKVVVAVVVAAVVVKVRAMLRKKVLMMFLGRDRLRMKMILI